jgi:hypothetical protein
MRHFLGALIVACAPLAAVGAQRAEYAVKIVCGAPDHAAVANGYYYTAINVHNPSRGAEKLRWKIALTLPQIGPGPITTFFDAVLKPDQALEIECSDIVRRSPKMRFYKGFIVIQSETEFDVVGVYTAAQSIEGRVVALEIERVPVRRPIQ